MNQNEPSTKLAVRALALELATKAHSETSKETVDRASVYADYIIGDNDMPEFVDTREVFKRMQESLDKWASMPYAQANEEKKTELS